MIRGRRGRCQGRHQAASAKRIPSIQGPPLRFQQHLTDPYGFYRQLREQDPVHRTPHGLWVLTRYADVAALLRDPRFGREGFERHFGTGGGSRGKGAGDGLADAARLDPGGHRQSMLFRDPPHHTRLRDAVSRAFTPRVAETLRPRIQAHIDALLDRVAPTCRMDVIADLAEPLPRGVIGELLGIPEAHRPACAAWSAAVARSLDALPIPEDRPLVAEGRGAGASSGATSAS
jgi:cytochrome P450